MRRLARKLEVLACTSQGLLAPLSLSACSILLLATPLASAHRLARIASLLASPPSPPSWHLYGAGRSRRSSTPLRIIAVDELCLLAKRKINDADTEQLRQIGHTMWVVAAATQQLAKCTAFCEGLLHVYDGMRLPAGLHEKMNTQRHSNEHNFGRDQKKEIGNTVFWGLRAFSADNWRAQGHAQRGAGGSRGLHAKCWPPD
jgi:hypothetical protein